MAHESTANLNAQPVPSNRRQFLRRAGQTVAAAATLVSLPSSVVEAAAETQASEAKTGSPGGGRAEKAYEIRRRAALYQKELPAVEHLPNGDDGLYPSRIASFTKGLPHNQLGEVDVKSYAALITALADGNPMLFSRIPCGGKAKLVNPQAAFAYELEGTDSHNLGMSPSPAFNSAEAAGEMVELYWQALARDIPFARYHSHIVTRSAAAELSKLTAFRAPKVAGRITPAVLFRGHTESDAVGPYVSQFLWKDVPYGALTITQRIRTAVPELDFLTSYPAWLAVQNGGETWANQYDPTPRYIRNGRDLAEYVHQDFSYQAFLNACLILLGMGAPRDDRNPYKHAKSEAGFCTFGAPHLLDAVARVANCGLKAAWYQKWAVHRRLRPEEFGGRVHNQWTGAAAYALHRDVLKSSAIEAVFKQHGSHLLPQAYPEGCPLHPAYPAGHAVIAGACATILKAFFDESFHVPTPVVASDDGLALTPYQGSPLTVGGELDKLASNVALGRDFAGVHWRSDSVEGLKLGEAVALGVLTDMKDCFNERFGGFSLTKFDGEIIAI